MRLPQIGTIFLSAVLCLVLSACGFHLRETTELPTAYQQVSLKGLSVDQGFGLVLKDAFTDARSELVVDGKSETQLIISGLDEDKRVASYDSQLSVRQYLLFLMLDYRVMVNGKEVAKQRIKLDKTMNYDADYVLGKQEEEGQIRKALRQDAARLILLRLKSLTL